MKKVISKILVVCMAICLVGCSSKDTEMSKIEDAQNNISSMTSGKFEISTMVKTNTRTDATKTEFTFQQMQNGIIEYCQSQQDSRNKLVFCEYSDGESAEQWLLGKGWSVIEPTKYTLENPHRFISLITSKIDKGSVKSVTKSEDTSYQVYEVEMDCQKVPVSTEGNEKLTSQKICFYVNSDGLISKYTDETIFVNTQTEQECQYSLEISLSEHNTLASVKKPDLKVDEKVDDVSADLGVK
ncbi:MAG: hypothetical protein RSE93_03795 [Oscillospiraceae bacterium]